jgi:hypothetical protein
MVAKPKPSCFMFSSFSPKLEIEFSPSPKIHKTRLLCFLTASSPHSCWKHSYYAAHSTALLPRTSPRTTPAPFPYICKPASKLTKPKTPQKKKKKKKKKKKQKKKQTRKSFRFAITSQHTRLQHFLLPISSPPFPLFSVSLSLSFYTRKSERITDCRSI